ncbi:hypothetical protein ACHAWX_002696 [Stephanocyclus meneghinianus]
MMIVPEEGRMIARIGGKNYFVVILPSFTCICVHPISNQTSSDMMFRDEGKSSATYTPMLGGCYDKFPR